MRITHSLRSLTHSLTHTHTTFQTPLSSTQALEVRKKILQLVRDKGTGDSLAIATAFKQKGVVAVM